MNRAMIQKQLNCLTGKRLVYAGRTCELVQFEFEEAWHDPTRINGGTDALHVFCSFRIANSRKVLTGSTDLFTAMDNNIPLDLGKRETTVFDKRIAYILERWSNEIVRKVTVNCFGDLCIHTDHLSISTFCSSSANEEEWRFFHVGREDVPHIVKYGKGFEED